MYSLNPSGRNLTERHQLKILIAVNSLVQGGAQRFSVNLAKELKNRNHDVEFLTFYPEESDFFRLSKNIPINRFIHPFQDRNRTVSIHSVQCLIRVYWRLRDLYAVRKLIVSRNPDLVLAVESYVGVLTGIIMPSRIPLVISERIHPNYHSVTTFQKYFQRLVYRRKSVHLHAQGWEISRYLRDLYKKPVLVLPNIVLPKFHFSETKKKNQIIVLARYSHQKGLDLLLEAWARIPLELRADWKISIFGDGDRVKIYELSESLNLGESVTLNGPSHNLEKLFAESAIFILPSRYEGFPNALAEAMANGIPSIATDCPSAVRELTLDGALARLTPVSSEGLKAALSEFLADKTLRDKMGEKATLVTQLFSPEIVTTQWIDFFVSIVDPQSFDIACKACGNRMTKENIVESSHKRTLENHLKYFWDIQFNYSSTYSPLVARFLCPICLTSSFSEPEGDELFYKACHKSAKYSRTDNWDYVKSIVQKSILTKGNVLDFGFGISRYLDILDLPEVRLSIVELDEQTRKIQENRVNRVFTNLDELTGQYNLIMMSHVLEHVFSPALYLNKLKQHLTKDGLLFVTVPNATFGERGYSALDWPPHHLTRFSAAGMKKLAESCGLKIKRIHTKDQSNVDQFDFMFELVAS
jgi:glycosyltransferase involved in cell wall biosynthesis